MQLSLLDKQETQLWRKQKQHQQQKKFSLFWQQILISFLPAHLSFDFIFSTLKLVLLIIFTPISIAHFLLFSFKYRLRKKRKDVKEGEIEHRIINNQIVLLLLVSQCRIKGGRKTIVIATELS